MKRKRKMNILLGLKLTSDANMVSDTVSIKNISYANDMHLLTDFKYKTEIGNVTYHYLPKIISKIPVIRLLYRIPVMLNICRINKIDLLICFHLTSYGLVGFIVSRLLKIPIIMHFLGKDIDILCRNKYYGSTLLWLTSKMDKLTVQGQKSKQFLEERGIENVSIIPTVCNIEKIQKVNVQKEYDLVFVGRLSKEKRPDRFVNIVRLVASKRKSVKAVILGVGPCERELKMQVKANHLEGYIDFVGWTDKVEEYLNKSKIFMLTSDNDQLPLSLLEAMASELVPVASNVGNVADVVKTKNGYLIDKDDLRGFSNAVIELLDNETIYYKKAQNSREKIRREYTISENTRRWTNVIYEMSYG